MPGRLMREDGPMGSGDTIRPPETGTAAQTAQVGAPPYPAISKLRLFLSSQAGFTAFSGNVGVGELHVPLSPRPEGVAYFPDRYEKHPTSRWLSVPANRNFSGPIDQRKPDLSGGDGRAAPKLRARQPRLRTIRSTMSSTLTTPIGLPAGL